MDRTGGAIILVQKEKKNNKQTHCNADKAYLALGHTRTFVAEWGMQNKYSLSCISCWTIAIPSSQKHKRFWSVGCWLFGRRSRWVGVGEWSLGFQEKLFSGMSPNGKIGTKLKYQCCCWQILELTFCLCSSPLGVVFFP